MKKRRISKERVTSKLFFSLYYLGLILGAAYFADTSTLTTNGYFTYYIDTFLQRHITGNFLLVFSYAFLATLGLNLLLLIGSLSCFGAPFILLLPLLQGISGGMINAALYLKYGLKGILFFALILWIPDILRSLELLFFSVSSFRNSGQMLRYAIGHKNGALILDSRTMMQDFILYASVGLAAALLESFFTLLFGPVFYL